MTYRPDIDGLRSIAILSVIFFHINPKWLPGGFVGVDVFFVISGYLISLYLFKALINRRFSLTEFYRRRVKRIAPAMLLVLFATTIAAQLLLRPIDTENVARSAAWSLASLANIYFWLFQDVSYFAQASDELPLLHYWSLGVEEQFYVIWPLLLWAAYRRLSFNSFAAVIAISSIASFSYGQWYFSEDPSFVYYMLPTRAGELLLGAFVAHGVAHGRLGKISRELCLAAGSIGLILVIGSLFLVSNDRVFPGLQAIPPTVGAALIILAGTNTLTLPSRLLSALPMVAIGLVSYSAYLWHWPILAFLNYGHVAITGWLVPLYLLVTFGLAWMTYRFVEGPTRRFKGSLIGASMRYLILPGTLLLALAATILKTDGMLLRPDARNYAIELSEARFSSRPAYEHDEICQVQRASDAILSDSNCIVGASTLSEPRILLWGDSHAAHYLGMLDEFGKALGFSFRNIEIGLCPPILDVPGNYVMATARANCDQSSRIIAEHLDHYETIIIGAQWMTFIWLSDRFKSAFEEQLRSFDAQGKTVILLGNIATNNNFDRYCKEKSVSFPGLTCRFSPTTVSDQVASANRWLTTISADYPKIHFMDVNRYFCVDGKCPVTNADGTSNYFDTVHITVAASRRLGQKIVAAGTVPDYFQTNENTSTSPQSE